MRRFVLPLCLAMVALAALGCGGSETVSSTTTEATAASTGASSTATTTPTTALGAPLVDTIAFPADVSVVDFATDLPPNLPQDARSPAPSDRVSTGRSWLSEAEGGFEPPVPFARPLCEARRWR